MILKTHLQANVAPFIPGWVYILERLRNNDAALRTASLAGLGVDDSGATSLSSALEGNRHLKHLHLSQNQIGADGVQQLAALLPRNPLASLHLDCNRIGPHGAGALAHALAQDSACLLHLSLDFTGISDAGATQLAQCLEHNRHLSSLSLVGNELADSGAFALAHALVANEALTHLQLDSNCIADAGATRMIQALERKTSLRVLSLDGNPIGVYLSLSLLSLSLCVSHMHADCTPHKTMRTVLKTDRQKFLDSIAKRTTRDARARPGETPHTQHMRTHTHALGREGVIRMGLVLQRSPPPRHLQLAGVDFEGEKLALGLPFCFSTGRNKEILKTLFPGASKSHWTNDKVLVV